MKKTLCYQDEEGNKVYAVVESDSNVLSDWDNICVDDSDNASTLVGGVEKLIEKGTEIVNTGFKNACEGIGPVITGIYNSINEQDTPPDEIEAEIGFTINSDAKIAITELSSEIAIKLKVKWNYGRNCYS